MHVNHDEFDDFDGSSRRTKRGAPRERLRKFAQRSSGRLPPGFTRWALEDWSDLDANDIIN